MISFGAERYSGIVATHACSGFLFFSLSLMSTFEDIRHRPPQDDLHETAPQTRGEDVVDNGASLRGESLVGNDSAGPAHSIEQLVRYETAFARLDEGSQYLIDAVSRGVTYQKLADEMNALIRDGGDPVSKDDIARLVYGARLKLIEFMQD